MSLSEKLEAARVALGKRKERELLALGPAPAKAEPAAKTAPAPAPGSNKLLAGQLAHEFLARGTLRGRPVEPSLSAAEPESEPEPESESEREPKRRYAEVSWLLMASGARVSGVVNPTQLGRWLQIKD
ncbi:hypothetical protein GUJ93_ZPchr0014g46903 [Zizania palustris]|uniref:Uncharacterized protein n=1 Tax=Zizania palustris TaxID=103762 RepID=A0A8J5SX15_ZIZPA|nr:hypothetical protein GUJ93_ZPchr0014g46903 [Zizania palustris]